MLALLTLISLAAVACVEGGSPNEGEVGEVPFAVGESVEECIVVNPIESEARYDDLEYAIQACAADTPGCGDSAECMDGDTCNVAELMSLEAAICIADFLGVEAGLRGRSGRLLYQPDIQRLVWVVESVLSDNGSDGARARALLLDAITGDVVSDLFLVTVPSVD